jgi:microcystin-dependent protein
MAQADQTVQNDTFPNVRADINNNLAALFTNSSGATAPTVTIAYMDWIDTSGVDPIWKKRNAANSAWITVGTIKTNTIQFGSETPAGAIQFYAASSAPTGWLKANGALVSRSTYADLFSAIGTIYGIGDGSTTFALPDLRGEFPRGWDDGRGVDSGRAFGSAQADDFKSHTHTIATRASVQSGGAEEPPLDATGAAVAYPTSSTGGTETRPRNIALLAIIKF